MFLIYNLVFYCRQVREIVVEILLQEEEAWS